MKMFIAWVFHINMNRLIRIKFHIDIYMYHQNNTYMSIPPNYQISKK